MKNEILKLLENDARLTDKQLAVMMNTDEAKIRDEIDAMEKNGTILAYKTIIDWEKTENESVTAMIDVKLTPQKERGFDRVAEKIYNYPDFRHESRPVRVIMHAGHIDGITHPVRAERFPNESVSRE